VQFAVDGMNVGAPVSLDAKGRATWETTGLKVGKHQITASYTPGVESVFLPSTSVTKIHIVKRCPCGEREHK
jgi:predicted secreted protein